MELGCSLSSEEFSPDQLINFARQAERAGFKFSLISDHYHPWTNQQPHSPFVWSTIGGISQVVERLWVGTGVTSHNAYPPGNRGPGCCNVSSAHARQILPGRWDRGELE